MNVQQNSMIAEECYRFFQLGNIPGILDNLTDDIEFFFPGPADLIPHAGTFRGKEEIARFFDLVHNNLDFERFEPTAFIAQEDKVVILGNYKGTIRPTGKTIEAEWAHLATIRDGKMCRWQGFEDTYQIAMAFSLENVALT